MRNIIVILTISLILASSLVWGSDSLSYSGRLVNENGSPVTGDVNLKFEIAYTNDLNVILCSQQLTNVSLSHGVFHAKLTPACHSATFKKVLEDIPPFNSIAIRVTDESANKKYPFQALHSVPLTLMSQMSKQLVQMGAKEGQVLTWNGAEWGAADPASSTQGTVTSVTATDGLYGTITDSGVIGIQDQGVTSQKLAPMGATVTGQVLKWNGSQWVAGSDSGLISESDPSVKSFAKIDLPACGSNEYYTHDVIVGFRCAKINSDELDEGVSKLFFTEARAKAAAVEDALNDNVTDVAPSQNKVFDALLEKQEKITNSTSVTMKSLRLTNDGSSWVDIKVPNLAGNYNFILPKEGGEDGQFLKTDASGNLTWGNVTSGTIKEVSSIAPLSGNGTSDSVELSLNYDDVTLGLDGIVLTVKDEGITNSKISAGANIDWSKINKTGATASDVGAVPTTRTITPGTGLLGGGDLSTDRSLSVNVGTNAGQIIQVGPDGKLPVIDGSHLTNLTWSQIVSSTLPEITPGVGLTSTGSLASGQTLNVDVGTGANQIVRLDGNAKLPAVDGSQLTNLGTDHGKWSDASGGIHYSSGNVGIGTSNPAAKLEVAGGIKLGSMTACTVTEEGSQRYNASLKIMEFCDGVAWQSFAGSSSIPTGAIMAFDLTSCPTGWSEYLPARGRFLRGIDNGAGNDPDGTRAPGAVQADDFKSHTHSPNGRFASNYNVHDGDLDGSTVATGYDKTTITGTLSNTGGTETRPKNVAVMYCRKN